MSNNQFSWMVNPPESKDSYVKKANEMRQYIRSNREGMTDISMRQLMNAAVQELVELSKS